MEDTDNTYRSQHNSNNNKKYISTLKIHITISFFIPLFLDILYYVHVCTIVHEKKNDYGVVWLAILQYWYIAPASC